MLALTIFSRSDCAAHRPEGQVLVYIPVIKIDIYTNKNIFSNFQQIHCTNCMIRVYRGIIGAHTIAIIITFLFSEKDNLDFLFKITVKCSKCCRNDRYCMYHLLLLCRNQSRFYQIHVHLNPNKKLCTCTKNIINNNVSSIISQVNYSLY